MTLHFTTPTGEDIVHLDTTQSPPKITPRLCHDGKIRYYQLYKVLPCMTSPPSVLHVYYEEIPQEKSQPFRVVPL